jgi:acyl-CoA synthetase (AMP-forming)/AMP-acid ligase II
MTLGARTLGALLADNARSHGDRIAIVCDGRRVTYRELDQLANCVANALIEHGIAPGDRAAVYLPNGIELVAVLCGVLRAGAIVVPVSTRLAPAEVDIMMEDSRPVAVFFHPGVRSAVEAFSSRLANPILICDGGTIGSERDLKAIMTSGSQAPVAVATREADDALISYTSGTTGRPKGAISSHANLTVGSGEMTAQAWGLNAADAILITTPMAHRIGLARLANAFVLGAKLAIMPRFDVAGAVDLIESESVTVVSLVPTIARMLLPEIEKRPQACRSIRIVVATGEAFPEDVQGRLAELLPQVRVYGFYSQTEGGFMASLSPEDRVTHPGSVGRPVPTVEIRIVDDGLRDVRAGEAGEILVRCGAPGERSVMRGYYRMPEANAEAFVDGWLRTGDVGRFDKDGFLYFVDRAKDMIVSGGLNIYSREVELALVKHPAVADAAVIAVPDPEFGEAVMAFVELTPGGRATPDELVEHCRAHIAGYKKPKHVSFVDGLPRNTTGKVMKGPLREQARREWPDLFRETVAKLGA